MFFKLIQTNQTNPCIRPCPFSVVHPSSVPPHTFDQWINPILPTYNQLYNYIF